MKKRKSKKILKLIIFSMILLLLVITILVITNKQNDIYEEKKLEFYNVGLFYSDYNGELTIANITQKLKEITTNYLPELFNSLKRCDEAEIKEYYEQNNMDIKINLGIKTYEEFEKLVNEINGIQIDLKSWESIQIDRESFIENSQKPMYSYFEYEVTYENNSKIRYAVYISKLKGTTPNFVFDVVK